MADAQRTSEFSQVTRQPAKEGLLAAGSMAGALLASSCCIIPLALALLGASGAWIADLTRLEPLRPLFSGIAVVFIGLGFWRVYLRPRQVCEDGSVCAQPRTAAITKTTLWLSAGLVTLAMTVNWWAPLFY